MSTFGTSVKLDPTSDSLPTSELRIVIAEDHLVVADGIATMLSFEDDMEVVKIVSSGEELIETVRQLRPDVVLVDVHLNGMDGLTAIRELHAGGVMTRAMVLTMFTDHDTVTRAVAAGVAGYLPKNVRRQELVQALRAVATGKGFLHPDVTRPFLDRVGALAMHAGIRPLSMAEQEILTELATNKTAPQIAEHLGLHEDVVAQHVGSIYRKLKVHDRVDAVVVAMRHGLVR